MCNFASAIALRVVGVVPRAQAKMTTQWLIVGPLLRSSDPNFPRSGLLRGGRGLIPRELSLRCRCRSAVEKIQANEPSYYSPERQARAPSWYFSSSVKNACYHCHLRRKRRTRDIYLYLTKLPQRRRYFSMRADGSRKKYSNMFDLYNWNKL